MPRKRVSLLNSDVALEVRCQSSHLATTRPLQNTLSEPLYGSVSNVTSKVMGRYWVRFDARERAQSRFTSIYPYWWFVKLLW